MSNFVGIWDWQLKLDYTDKYNEELPKDWLKIIDKSPSVQLEKYMDNYVVRHCKPGDVSINLYNGSYKLCGFKIFNKIHNLLCFDF